MRLPNAESMPTNAKLGPLGSLYFSQGLPFGFFTQASPVILRKQSFSLEEIGLPSHLAAPWALKLLWAPAADRYGWPRIGRRKSWILPLQLMSVVTLGVLALGSGTSSVRLSRVAARWLDEQIDGLAAAREEGSCA